MEWINYEDKKMEYSTEMNHMIPNLKLLLSDIFKLNQSCFINFAYISDGISNISFRFQITDKEYIIRCPRRIDCFDRQKREYEIYTLLESKQIVNIDKVVYFNWKKGIKITHFIPNTYYPDAMNEDHQIRCLSLLKKIHTAEIKSKYELDLGKALVDHEKELSVVPAQYLKFYADIREAFYVILHQQEPTDFVFCHTDPIKYNFLFTDQEDYLIDFEFASMCSPMLDLASFAIYNKFNDTQILRMLELYLSQKPTSHEVIHLEAYLAMEGLLSTLWYLNRIQDAAHNINLLEISYSYAIRYTKNYFLHSGSINKNNMNLIKLLEKET